MRSFLTLILLVGVVSVPMYAQLRLSAEHYFAMGVRDERKDAHKATPSFLKAATLYPANSDRQIVSTVKAAQLANREDIYQDECFDLIRFVLKGIRKRDRQDTLAGDLYFEAGAFYTTHYLPDSAILCFEKAKTIFAQRLGKDHLKVARCYNEMGDIYKYDLYDFGAAEENNEKALTIYEKQRPPNAYQIARVYYSLAAINRSQKDYQKALSYGIKTMQFVQKIDNNEFLERAYLNVGNIYTDLHEYDSANRLYQRGIQLNRIINRGRENETLAVFYQGLGQSLKLQGKYGEATKNLEVAIGIYKKIGRVVDKILLVNNLQRLADIKLSQGKNDASIALLKEAEALLKKIHREKSGQAALLYKSFGDFFKSKDNPDTALYYYQKSLVATSATFKSLNYSTNPSLADIELKNYAYETLLIKAGVLVSLYRERNDVRFIHLALDCFSLAEQLLSRSRDDLDMEDAKWLFFDSNFELYEKSIRVIFELMKKDHHDSLNNLAFRYFESSKSKTLGDAMAQAVSLDTIIAQDSLLTRLNHYKQKVLMHQDQLRKLEGAAKDERTINAMRSTIVDDDRNILLTEEIIKKKYPSYLKIRKELKNPAITDVQQVIGENTAVIEYFWGVKDVYGVVITSKGIDYKRLGAADSLGSEINAFLSFFRTRSYSNARADIDLYATNSYKLYQELVLPFSHIISGHSKIIVIPDGPVSQIPFEVLTTSLGSRRATYKELDYLIKDFSVSYMFSTLFLLNQGRNKMPSPKMLAFGFTGGLPLRSYPENGSIELRGSEAELEALEKKFPQGRFLLGSDVTELNFKREAPAADIIHLAIHGRGDTEQNYSASLFFHHDAMDKEDGELHWYELYGMKIKAALTVLSSCESGIGKVYKGEGMLSMANAFAFAGSKNIVMGLWKVDDRVSVKLMDEFYGQLLKGKTVDEALADSKRKYLHEADELTANPKMWGSLVAYGNQRVIDTKRGNWIWIIAIASGLSFFVLVYFRKQKSVRP